MNVLKIGDREVSLQELVSQVKISGWDTVLKPMVRQQIIIECARERELSVPDEALQIRFEDIRRSRGLFTKVDTERWMKENNRTLEDLEQEAEVAELTDMLEASFSRDAVMKYFAGNKLAMDAAEISVITVAEREVAEELAELLREGEEDFVLMAAEHSTDRYSKAGGYMGIVRRTGLPEAVAAAVFGAKPGDVAGPVEMDGGFVIAKLHNLIPAVLDGAMEREIRRALLESLLAQNWKKTVWLV